jgi:hypothetical protein
MRHPGTAGRGTTSPRPQLWHYDIGQINLASFAVAKVRMKFWHGGCEAIFAIDVKACFGCHRWSSLYDAQGGNVEGVFLIGSTEESCEGPVQREENSSRSLFSILVLTFKLFCVERKGRKGEGRRVEWLKQDSAVK